MSPLTRDTVLFALSCHVGEAAGIHARDLVMEICGETSPADERALRAIVDKLRHEGTHICGLPSTGYYMAANEDELLRTCEFLWQRSINGLEQIAAMRQVSLPDMRGQLRLPLEYSQAATPRGHAQPAVAHNTGSLSLSCLPTSGDQAGLPTSRALESLETGHAEA